VSAILQADLIVLGPGSLYTSILPNLLVPDIVRAIRASTAPKVYVINVATQTGETDHFTALDHVRVIDQHLGPNVLDAVLVNSNPASARAIGPELAIDPVLPDSLEHLDPRIRVIARDIVNSENPLRHDPNQLALALLEVASGQWHDERLLGQTQLQQTERHASRRELAAAGTTKE
jgi:uncharacterized cofD-like protein